MELIKLYLNLYPKEGFDVPVTGLARSQEPTWHHPRFGPARPNGSRRGGRGLSVSNEILGLAGRNYVIDVVIGHQILYGTSNQQQLTALLTSD